MDTKIHNSDLIAALVEAVGIVGNDNVPAEIASKVVPVIDVNPLHARRCRKCAGANAVTTGAFSIYTAPTDVNHKDAYLTACSLTLIKDATCDAATGAINLFTTIDGAAANLLYIPIITTTAQSETISISFPTPIKLDPARAIQVSGTYTAGVMSRAASAIIYEIPRI